MKNVFCGLLIYGFWSLFWALGALGAQVGALGAQDPPRPDFYRFLIDLGSILGGFWAPRSLQILDFEGVLGPKILQDTTFSEVLGPCPQSSKFKPGGGMLGFSPLIYLDSIENEIVYIAM